MEKERVIKEEFFDLLNEFCLSCFMESERGLYDKSGFDRACREVQNFDIFSEEFLSNKIKTGEVTLLYKEEGGAIVAAAALEIKTGRLLFCLAKLSHEKYLKELLTSIESRMIPTETSGSYVISTLAFQGQAKKLERLGFYKVKSEVVICGVKFTALKFVQEQGDIENY